MEKTWGNAEHSRFPGPYECPDSTCGRHFDDLDAFHKHWTRHRNRCPFPACMLRLNSKYNFERHCARRHGDHFAGYQSIEKSACKHHCGKLYSQADVSNLKRHERTCRGYRTGQRPPDPTVRVDLVDGDVTFATDQSSHHADISGGLHNLVEYARGGALENCPFSDRLALLKTHNLHGRVGRARGSECWRDNRPVVEAIKTLQRIFTGGPAAEALQVLTISLENLGPSSHMAWPSDPNESNISPARSDENVGSYSVQQAGFAPSLIIEDEEPTHGYHEQYGTEQNFGRKLILGVVAFKVCLAYDLAWFSTLTGSKIIKTFLAEISSPNHDKDLYFSSPRVLREVSDFCEWFEIMIASFHIRLHLDVISLGLLLVYEISSLFECKPEDQRRVVSGSLMWAEFFYASVIEPNTAASWAREIAVPEAQMIIMKIRYHEEMEESMQTVFGLSGDMSEIRSALSKAFQSNAGFEDASHHWLLPHVRGRHRLSPEIGNG
jgi:hypothetical protein